MLAAGGGFHGQRSWPPNSAVRPSVTDPTVGCPENLLHLESLRGPRPTRGWGVDGLDSGRGRAGRPRYIRRLPRCVLGVRVGGGRRSISSVPYRRRHRSVSPALLCASGARSVTPTLLCVRADALLLPRSRFWRQTGGLSRARFGGRNRDLGGGGGLAPLAMNDLGRYGRCTALAWRAVSGAGAVIDASTVDGAACSMVDCGRSRCRGRSPL